jgi:peptide deformylase
VTEIPPLLDDKAPILKRVMPLVDIECDDITGIADTLIRSMVHYGGIGLAANQIGIEKRACAITLDGVPTVMFNPEITEVSDTLVKITEGCLSFGNVELRIKRPQDCSVRYTDASGEVIERKLFGMDARCALHEIDHLNGIVFSDHVARLTFKMAKNKATKRLT